MSARPRRNLRRFRAVVLSVVGGVQVPGVAALAHYVGWPAAAGGATLLSLPYLVGLRSPFEDRPKSRLYLYGALFPFFAWWVACLVFAGLSPLALGVSAAAHLPHEMTFAIAGALSLLAGLLATSREPRLVERELVFEDLPPSLDGYKIAQISDVHCGSFTPAVRVAAWVAELNAQKPDLVAITGDLITSGDDYVEAVTRALGQLRGKDGVFACMGNHDYFTGADVAAALERNGVEVLRNHGRRVRDGLYVGGVDDTWTRRNDVPASLAARKDGEFSLLLAHDPNLFTEAAEHDVSLTLSGHTHGGQLAVPFFSRKLTLARVITPYPAGHYRIGESQLYVNLGAGTTGPPVRLGARAELTVLTLRARK
jgi:uncharacterized protein